MTIFIIKNIVTAQILDSEVPGSGLKDQKTDGI
jgi:hypothetical protein